MTAISINISKIVVSYSKHIKKNEERETMIKKE